MHSQTSQIRSLSDPATCRRNWSREICRKIQWSTPPASKRSTFPAGTQDADRISYLSAQPGSDAIRVIARMNTLEAEQGHRGTLVASARCQDGACWTTDPRRLGSHHHVPSFRFSLTCFRNVRPPFSTTPPHNKIG